MSSDQDMPSIIDRGITSFRGGQKLRYSDLTGREKRDCFFDAGIRATADAHYPGEAIPSVHHEIRQFAESALSSITGHLLSGSLTPISDVLKTPKLKLFHTYGAAAKVCFRPAPSTLYTGIFREGAHGLARFSYAGLVLGVGIMPGLGLKSVIDGDHSSENAIVMRILDPQSQHSVFQNAFTNILPSPRFTNLVMRVVKARFETVVVEDRGLHQPVQNLARVQATGMPVKGDTWAPYRINFRPQRRRTACLRHTAGFPGRSCTESTQRYDDLRGPRP